MADVPAIILQNMMAPTQFSNLKLITKLSCLSKYHTQYAPPYQKIHFPISGTFDPTFYDQPINHYGSYITYHRHPINIIIQAIAHYVLTNAFTIFRSLPNYISSTFHPTTLNRIYYNYYMNEFYVSFQVPEDIESSEHSPDPGTYYTTFSFTTRPVTGHSYKLPGTNLWVKAPNIAFLFEHERLTPLEPGHAQFMRNIQETDLDPIYYSRFWKNIFDMSVAVAPPTQPLTG
jgi:hypothetical protein